MTHANGNTTQSTGNRANLNDMPKEVGKAYNYFLKGLKPKEIAKLMGVSVRTFQRWKNKYHFDKLTFVPEPEFMTIQQRAFKMANAGLSYSEIGRKLKRCKSTIYNYIRQERQKEKQPIPDRLQRLFNYMEREHGVILLQSEMMEIINIVNSNNTMK